MKGSKGAAEVVPMAVPLVAVPALGPALDMVKVTGGESKAELEGDPKGPEEESECRLG